VTNPAQSNVMPRAVIIGQTVGAGSSIIPGVCSLFSSANIVLLRRPMFGYRLSIQAATVAA
jgi:hypothetical protein